MKHEARLLGAKKSFIACLFVRVCLEGREHERGLNTSIAHIILYDGLTLYELSPPRLETGDVTPAPPCVQTCNHQV